MPIHIDKKTFKSFAEAVKYVMATKGMDEKSASAYVAAIEMKQHPKKK